MKPFARISDCATHQVPATTQAQSKRLERVWMKVDGKLECRFVSR
ncbi:MAG: hypothetical protein WDM79_15735 [Terricaulis sp.]